MDYIDAKRLILTASSHVGQTITRKQACDYLTGDARKSAMHNNVLNDVVICYRSIGSYIVEIALSDWTGMRGGTYMAGVTVFGHDDLSELINIDKLRDKLKSLTAYKENTK